MGIICMGSDVKAIIVSKLDYEIRKADEIVNKWNGGTSVRNKLKRLKEAQDAIRDLPTCEDTNIVGEVKITKKKQKVKKEFSELTPHQQHMSICMKEGNDFSTCTNKWNEKKKM